MTLKTSEIEAVLEAPVEKVWDAVTSSIDWSWRRDLRSRASLGTYSWKERDRWGLCTDYGVMDQVKCCRSILHMENARCRGQWAAHMEPLEGGRTRFSLKLSLHPRNYFLWILAKPFWTPEKYLERYLRDLRNKVENR